ncbi:MAG: Holliday junction branch migration protein RuvA [Ruthenibacterium sp.]
MIYCLTGKLLEKTPDEAVIDCTGVGYLVFIPSTTAGALPAVGEPATLYTSMNVTDNAVSLYGFADKESRAMFSMLTGVSGVGPKVGLAILSALSCQRIALSISAGDHKALTAANGVGPKLAQRLVLELKDKMGRGMAGGISLSDLNSATPMATGAVAQAIAALTSLGYTGTEAAQAVASIDDTLPAAEIIRVALQSMGKGR